MKVIQLSEQFYTEYANCEEILKKTNRPYLCILVKLSNMDFAIPFRHHIKHQYCFHTLNEAGIDYTKAIPIIRDYFITDIEAKLVHISIII